MGIFNKIFSYFKQYESDKAALDSLTTGVIPNDRKALFGFEQTLAKDISWSLCVSSQRQKKTYFLARCLSFYFSSLFHDRSLLSDILLDPSDVVLLDSPLSCSDEEFFELAHLDANGKIIYEKVIYRKKTLRVCKHDLIDFLRRSAYTPVNRPVAFISDKVVLEKVVDRRFTPPLPLTRLYSTIGHLTFATLKLDEKRSVPVTRIRIESLNETEKKYLLWTAQDRRNFGNHRIWSIWGTVEESPTAVSLILEDISLGPLNEFVSAAQRSNVELLNISVQMVEACRYLEKYDFIHRNLQLDAFIISSDLQIKLALFCFQHATLFTKEDDYEDVDRCRWVPFECLPLEDKTAGTPYDMMSMVHTFGTCLWSLFHSAILPYENETAEQITNRTYRSTAQLAINDECMPEQFSSIVKNHCWQEDPKEREGFLSIKKKLRSHQGHFTRESNRALQSPTSPDPT